MGERQSRYPRMRLQHVTLLKDITGKVAVWSGFRDLLLFATDIDSSLVQILFALFLSRFQVRHVTQSNQELSKDAPK